VSILVVLAGGEMEIELVPATEKSMIFLKSQNLEAVTMKMLFFASFEKNKFFQD
jgi:hypothetical protein